MHVKTTIFCLVCLFFSCPLFAQSPEQLSQSHPGRLFIIEVMGDKVIYQAGANKFWYPELSDTFNMNLNQQLAYIEGLDFAGIKDWRIGYYHDVTPMKAALFGGAKPGTNTVPFFHTSIYFPYTSTAEMNGATTYYVHGRTGDEWGDPAQGGNGAFISVGPMTIGLPLSDRYLQSGVAVPAAAEGDFETYKGPPGMGPWLQDGRPRTFYTMIPTHAQDHWACFEGRICAYNDDLNYSPHDLPYCLQDSPQERDCGAWTVSEQFPQIWDADDDFKELRISAAIHEDSSLVPVEIISIMQDEELNLRSRPDAIVSKDRQAAIINLRASRDKKGDGRLYRIDFTDGQHNYFIHIGVPNLVDNRHLMENSGIEIDSL